MADEKDAQQVEASSSEDSIKVICRFRPLNDTEEKTGSKFIIKFPSGSDDQCVSIAVNQKINIQVRVFHGIFNNYIESYLSWRPVNITEGLGSYIYRQATLGHIGCGVIHHRSSLKSPLSLC